MGFSFPLQTPYVHSPIGATTRNDIAVLKLDGIVDPKEKRIYPICMPKRGTRYLGKRCLVAGWGYVSRVRLANSLQASIITKSYSWLIISSHLGGV